MPKSLEKAVSAMIADPDFYPKKSAEDRKSIAYGIATNQLKKKKKQFIALSPEVRAKLLQMPDSEPGLQLADITFDSGYGVHTEIQGQKIHYGMSLELDGEIDLDKLGKITEIRVNS